MFNSKLKIFLRRSLRKLPGEGSGIKKAYWGLQSVKRSIQSHLSLNKGRDFPDPQSVYWISPRRIEYHTDYHRLGEPRPLEQRVFHPTKDVGASYDGDWDVSTHRFEDLAIARAIRDRVTTDSQWSDTEFYRDLLSTIESGGKAPWDLRSRADLEARCEYLDRLIESIRANGFKQNFEIEIEGGNAGLDRDPRFSAEITVNIGRDGKYLFQHGRHRLSIAKALDVPLVPVKVLVRHTKWVEFRRNLLDLEPADKREGVRVKLNQKAVHPDLEDVPYDRDCDVCYETIVQHLPERRGRVLDVGCGLGFFCHRLESIGFECIGVERDVTIAEAAEVLRSAEGRDFQILTDDIFSVSQLAEIKGKSFAFVLILGGLPQFTLGQSKLQELRLWLQNIEMETMFFRTQSVGELSSQSRDLASYEDEVTELILRNSVLSNRQLLHRCADGRGLFRLSRN